MANTSAKGALTAVQVVFGVVSGVSAILGIVNDSVIVAVNTAGLIGIFGLFFGGCFWFNLSDEDELDRVRVTAWATGIPAAIGGFIYFVFGRALDESEKQPNILTLFGVVVVFTLAWFGTVAWAAIQRAGEPPKKKCPDCANLVLEEARRCQYCGFAFQQNRKK